MLAVWGPKFLIRLLLLFEVRSSDEIQPMALEKRGSQALPFYRSATSVTFSIQKSIPARHLPAQFIPLTDMGRISRFKISGWPNRAFLNLDVTSFAPRYVEKGVWRKERRTLPRRRAWVDGMSGK